MSAASKALPPAAIDAGTATVTPDVRRSARRTGIRKAKSYLRKRVGDELMKNVQFLMDFEGAVDAGDIEDAGPPPADTAE